MSATWNFGDLEFVVLWERITGADDLPTPFLYTSRTPDYFDFLREKREAEERLAANPDRSFDRVAAAIAQPDLTIVLNGFDGRQPDRADGRVRLLGLRRADQGVLIRQLAGESHLHSGGFTVTECDPLRLAEVAAASLPETGPGQRGDIPLADPNEPVDHEFGRSLISDIFEDSVSQRQQRFFAAPVECVGNIDVIQGNSKFGPRGITSFRLHWRDLEDDGRYLIGGEPPDSALAVDGKRLTILINQRIAAVIRAIKDERGALSASE